MIDILGIIAPIFIVMAAGFASVRSGLFEPGAMAPLGRFVLYIALPALIIGTLSRADLQHSFEPLFLIAYGGAALGCYVTVFAIARLVSRDAVSMCGIKALGGAFSNSAFVGYPLLLQVFDDPPIATFAMALVFENVVLMPIVLTVLESGAGADKANSGQSIFRETVSRVATNPIMIAIAIGVLLALLNIPLPESLNGSLDLLGKASAGTALFFIGTSLAAIRTKTRIPDVALIAASKLVLHPVLASLLILALPGFDHQLQQAAVLLAASPMLTIYPILSSKYGYTDFASSALLVTTSASFFTISAVLLLM